MSKKKPCKICGRWFLTSPRAGNRQRTCSDPRCQRERHRRNCAQWHRNNPDYDREERLRSRLVQQEKPRQRAVTADPLRAINETVARDLVGLQLYVFIEEIGKHLIDWARDLVREQAIEIRGEMRKQLKSGKRDEIVETPGAT
jgi:hypothetical protein